MPKNIVILSDGTGQEGGKGHDSNVYKLYRMLEDRTENQVVFYDEGLGTDWRKVSGSAFGVGFSKNLLDGYRFIFENYEAGDKLFLLGFSRGAATVRSLANFIHYFGILPKSRPKLIDQAYKHYVNRLTPEVENEEAGRAMKAVNNASYKMFSALHTDLDKVSREFVTSHPNQWVSIDFLGVWDTVPALGFVPMAGLDLLLDRIPWLKHSFHDFKLHPSVKNAYQALSIDDDRKWFFPTIWNQYDSSRQKVKQVWFSGSHTDVGGGFKEAGLSDIALEWMVDQAKQHGIRLYLNSKRYWNFGIAPDSQDDFHPPRAGGGKIYKQGSRGQGVWNEKAVKTFGPPIIHESVLARAQKIPDYRPWILDNYPDPEIWIENHLKDALQRNFEDELRPVYEEWYEKQRMKGDQTPKSFTEWVDSKPLRYKAWLKKNKVSIKQWLASNNLDIRTFNGKKYLVELHPSSGIVDDMRDYGINTRQDVLDTIEYDRSAYQNLYDRLTVNGRFSHERKRVMDIGIEDQLKNAR